MAGSTMKEKGSMMNRTVKSAVAVAAIAAMSLGTLAACGSSTSGDDAKGKVYYLNFKPEAADQWAALAKEYTKEKGVDVKVQTAASGTYEQTLKSEIAKSEAPTLFQVNGPVGYQNWKKYTADMSNTDVYKELTNQDVALKDGDKVVGVPYVMETYGLIYNKDILNKYFALDGAKATSMDEIDNFDTLKAVADDMQARKDELGFAAFTSAGMDGSSDWRYKTHLANLPIYFEYQADGIDTTDAIKGTYLDDYKNIFDLYINNSTCDPAELAGKTGDDSRNEFLNNEAVFFQNGSWEYNNLVGDGKPFTDEDLTMLPIYIGVGDEANQGLCTGTENFWCVNKEASADDIQATLDFMYWCVTSEEGTTAMANDMGFVIPFKKAVESPNLFVKVDNALTAAGKTPVAWCFSTMPFLRTGRTALVLL